VYEGKNLFWENGDIELRYGDVLMDRQLSKSLYIKIINQLIFMFLKKIIFVAAVLFIQFTNLSTQKNEINYYLSLSPYLRKHGNFSKMNG
jgi:hypothetical protein